MIHLVAQRPLSLTGSLHAGREVLMLRRNKNIKTVPSTHWSESRAVAHRFNMQPQAQQMMEKLEHLSPDRLAEVEDFIDFLQQRDQDQHLRRDFARIRNCFY